MRIEVLNISKYRTSARVGDDVPVVLPGALIGVCDGATDPRGTAVDGIGTGRLAALTVASAAAELAIDPDSRDMPAADLLGHLAGALARRTAPLNLEIPPSTTLALVFDCGDRWRFLTLGDTGIRINGTEVLRTDKLIDDVSTHARIAVFRHLAGEGPATDATEAATRRAILLGLDNAVAEGVIAGDVAENVIDATVRALKLDDHRAPVTRFLRGGIKTQFEFSNDPDSPLGFDTMNGNTPRRGDYVDVSRPKAQVQSIEIFSDGYPAIPDAVSLEAWEAVFAKAEAEDVHKIGAYATVKGSTTDEFFDDRTVIVVDRL
ncbi:hypothetical protein [Psychromarinibacter halotolerans]|uniref:Protein phosphatase 2C-like protein n=1 Tax=Psychromarinibacter halotolerans TaxID=1775175 RepID=A0ABV7GW72_9RHOB|nr:hypothetical protein [Psychromarinibacter halotolerans]MDF0597623.1 hypothetical protein [Psychromarinibacter halotolerans]